MPGANCGPPSCLRIHRLKMLTRILMVLMYKKQTVIDMLEYVERVKKDLLTSLLVFICKENQAEITWMLMDKTRRSTVQNDRAIHKW